MVDKQEFEEEIIADDTESATSHTEDIELEEEESLSRDKLKAVKESLKSCEAEKMKYLEDLQRAKADFLNSKRRLEEQLERDKERAKDRILIELLTLADSFDMATQDKEWSALDQKWKSGFEAVQTKLNSILRSNQVTEINPVKEKFNPEEHEAVSNQEVTDETQVDSVITVLQKGYKRGSDIIRPARVVVGTK